MAFSGGSCLDVKKDKQNHMETVIDDLKIQHKDVSKEIGRIRVCDEDTQCFYCRKWALFIYKKHFIWNAKTQEDVSEKANPPRKVGNYIINVNPKASADLPVECKEPSSALTARFEKMLETGPENSDSITQDMVTACRAWQKQPSRLSNLPSIFEPLELNSFPDAIPLIDDPKDPAQLLDPLIIERQSLTLPMEELHLLKNIPDDLMFQKDFLDCDHFCPDYKSPEDLESECRSFKIKFDQFAEDMLKDIAAALDMSWLPLTRFLDQLWKLENERNELMGYGNKIIIDKFVQKQELKSFADYMADHPALKKKVRNNTLQKVDAAIDGYLDRLLACAEEFLKEFANRRLNAVSELIQRLWDLVGPAIQQLADRMAAHEAKAKGLAESCVSASEPLGLQSTKGVDDAVKKVKDAMAERVNAFVGEVTALRQSYHESDETITDRLNKVHSNGFKKRVKKVEEDYRSLRDYFENEVGKSIFPETLFCKFILVCLGALMQEGETMEALMIENTIKKHIEPHKSLLSYRHEIITQFEEGVHAGRNELAGVLAGLFLHEGMRIQAEQVALERQADLLKSFGFDDGETEPTSKKKKNKKKGGGISDSTPPTPVTPSMPSLQEPPTKKEKKEEKGKGDSKSSADASLANQIRSVPPKNSELPTLQQSSTSANPTKHANSAKTIRLTPSAVEIPPSPPAKAVQTKPTQTTKPVQTPKSTQAVKPTQVAKPAQVAKPVQVAKPAQVVKQIQETKSTQVEKPAPLPKPVQKIQPVPPANPARQAPATRFSQPNQPVQPEVLAKPVQQPPAQPAKEDIKEKPTSVMSTLKGPETATPVTRPEKPKTQPAPVTWPAPETRKTAMPSKVEAKVEPSPSTLPNDNVTHETMGGWGQPGQKKMAGWGELKPTETIQKTRDGGWGSMLSNNNEWVESPEKRSVSSVSGWSASSKPDASQDDGWGTPTTKKQQGMWSPSTPEGSKSPIGTKINQPSSDTGGWASTHAPSLENEKVVHVSLRDLGRQQGDELLVLAPAQQEPGDVSSVSGASNNEMIATIYKLRQENVQLSQQMQHMQQQYQFLSSVSQEREAQLVKLFELRKQTDMEEARCYILSLESRISDLESQLGAAKSSGNSSVAGFDNRDLFGDIRKEIGKKRGYWNKQQQQQQQQPPRCGNCGDRGHWSKECTSACRYCEKDDHLSEACLMAQ